MQSCDKLLDGEPASDLAHHMIDERMIEMHLYKIYLEPADTDDERVYLGTVEADTMSEALDKAAQWNEIPQHDLVAVQVNGRQQQ